MNTKMAKVIFSAIVGNALEAYDLTAYGYFADAIAQPKQDKFTGIANVFAIFFISYLARPLGVLFFGHRGDQFGRKSALLASIWLVAVSTCGIRFNTRLQSYWKSHFSVTVPLSPCCWSMQRILTSVW